MYPKIEHAVKTETGAQVYILPAEDRAGERQAAPNIQTDADLVNGIRDEIVDINPHPEEPTVYREQSVYSSALFLRPGYVLNAYRVVTSLLYNRA